MTARQTGAVSPRAVDWHAIHGHHAHTSGRRLQARIVQATQRGSGGKGHALQRLLTPAFAANVLAVKRVTDNQGTRPAGVEQIRWDTPEHNAMAVATLRQHGYRALPGRRVSLPTQGGTGQRPLAMPCMHDRARQARSLQALDPIADTLAAPTAYGFRLARAPADASDQCHRVLALRWSAPGLLAGASRACFDRSSHDW
jgi:RNA-directed DNA polymerase